MIPSEKYIPHPQNKKYSSAITASLIRQLEGKYDFVETEIIGKSVLGQPIYCLKIGDGKRELSFNAAHHASEWITTPVLLQFLYEYADAIYKSKEIYGEKARQLFSSTSLYAIPQVNPDGVDLATGIISFGEHYEKAKKMSERYPDIPFPSCWKANINGVNLNLQYPAGWERARDYYFSARHIVPAPAHFIGMSPLSEPESRAMYDFTLKHDFRSVICLHTQGSEIFWQYGEILPEDAYSTGKILSEKSGYPLSEVPSNAAFAGYKDWFMEHFRRKGYTFELGRGATPLPVTDFDKIYGETAPALAAAIKIECG